MLILFLFLHQLILYCTSFILIKKIQLSFNLLENKKINVIFNAHKKKINNIIHYLDEVNKRDLILSISTENNNIKLWNIKNLECLINIENVNKKGFLHSACFLKNNKNIYIISCNCYWGGIPESIKIFDIKGNKIDEIIDSNDQTLFINSYYDNKSNINYILTGNKGSVKSYNFNKSKLYHKYIDDDINKMNHLCLTINDNEQIIKLIECCYDGYIRIWNFHSGEKINKIKACNEKLYCIYFWDNNNFLVGCNDNSIKIIDLSKGIIQN